MLKKAQGYEKKRVKKIRKVKIWTRLILILSGLFVGGLICEFILSVTKFAPEVGTISVGRFKLSNNPAIGYEPVPNYEYYGKDLYFYEFHGKSNSLGFRDCEHSLQKKEGVYRILIIGDSISMGLGIERTEDIYPVLLEKKLGELNKNIEVINFGVSGYNTQQEVGILIEKGLRFKPDLVLLQYCLNDITEVNGGIVEELRRREGESKRIDQSLVNPYLFQSAIYRFIYYRIFPNIFNKKVEARHKALDLLKNDTVKKSFQLLRRVTDENKFDVVVVVFPEFTGYLNAEYERISKLCKENKFFYLNLKPSFKELSQKGEQVMLDMWHPSVSGHAWAANTIIEYLVNNRIIK
ncbi:SGNH/GDSL hydrolase family protein [bacterium]|nr:SGNH/GDSL hydrolase family protein [bacterium]